ncbi:flagellar hook-associated protein FlgK [Pelosinus fermentans]|uniref:Flagellar hook-associated protein 1 n=1 Tax=Pelosinus fermentans JBW45 TaxID=1192197 RepID=I9NNP9_9FIRM|nr:flagellar hook-associated protein FlgK [Pelosinus fermentans]AJQ26070.1 flagellar hook-associated protein FlgK [Pelosinus fermentans JBW45]
MASTFGGLNIMTLGMSAQQLSQNTTGHNVANSKTDGYSRQTVNLITTTPQQIYTANGMSVAGTGVTTASITRARDFLVDTQYWQKNATKNYWSTQGEVLAKVENVFNDTKNTGIQNAIELFHTALGTLASNAGEPSARTSAREAASALVETMKTSGNNLVSQANDASSRIDTQITQVNSVSKQIAALNKQIVSQEATGATANDLRDQRDKLVDELSAFTEVNVSEEKNGSYTVMIAGGISLVQGDHATELTVEHGRNTPYGYDTTKVTALNGTVNVSFKNGSIASLTNLRDTTINGYLADLDAMAQSLLQDFNAQHKQGKTKDLNAADNFFGESFGTASTVNDYATGGANDPTVQTSPASWLSILKVNEDFYGTDGYNLIAAAGSSAAGSADGTTATALKNWLVDDPATASASLGKNSLSSYYGSIVSSAGVQTQQAKNMTTNQTVIFDSVATTRQSVSGVSMDEELSNMIKFQQAYAACGKMLATMDSMLDSLINIR